MSNSLKAMVSAGSQEFGVWHKNIVSYSDLHTYVKKWVTTVFRYSKQNTKITLLDIGCGNATTTIPIIREFAKTEKQIEYLLLEPQADALEEARKIIKNAKLASNVKYKYYHQRVEKMRISEKVDGISCIFVLHFLTPGKMLKALQEMYSLLNPGGYLVVSVPSIFDRKFLGIDDKYMHSDINKHSIKQRLSNIQQKTNRGLSDQIFQGKRGYKHMMYFFTQPALVKLVTTAGFTVHRVIWEKETNHSNRLSNRYMEILSIIAKK